MDFDEELAALGKDFAGLRDENARLQDEVERLRKAGDDLDHFLGVLGCTNDKGVRLAWQAAKEGKTE